MITIRKSNERGQADHGWLQSQHTFSFSSYYDPKHMGFRDLRVINEDKVAPGAGFPTHPHRDMEIISYVLDGSIEHKDSMGNGSVIRPGDVQRMTAGTGVTHSEFNHSASVPVHFLQIWVQPNRRGLAPGYAQKSFPAIEAGDGLTLVISPDGQGGSLPIHQDVRLYAAKLAAGKSMTQALAPSRHAWLQLITGSLNLGDATLQAGDGAAISDAGTIQLAAAEDAHFLLFDLA